MVEAQHVASTMKLVDDADEQALLETLIDTSKPRAPAGTAHLHYLLATPFRYSPRRGGSRFRDRDDPGVFYAAQGVRTACMEMGYWRWRFLMDAPALHELAPLAFTAFATRLQTDAVDLQHAPFDRDAAAWTHPVDYDATQAFARIAREAGVGAVLYRSVRDPQPAWCVALLTPEGFAAVRPDPGEQTWWLRVTRTQAQWKRDRDAWTWTPPS
jgi:hypothetical protein